jgi:hypothetical protein
LTKRKKRREKTKRELWASLSAAVAVAAVANVVMKRRNKTHPTNITSMIIPIHHKREVASMPKCVSGVPLERLRLPTAP